MNAFKDAHHVESGRSEIVSGQRGSSQLWGSTTTVEFSNVCLDSLHSYRLLTAAVLIVHRHHQRAPSRFRLKILIFFVEARGIDLVILQPDIKKEKTHEWQINTCTPNSTNLSISKSALWVGGGIELSLSCLGLQSRFGSKYLKIERRYSSCR